MIENNAYESERRSIRGESLLCFWERLLELEADLIYMERNKVEEDEGGSARANREEEDRASATIAARYTWHRA